MQFQTNDVTGDEHNAPISCGLKKHVEKGRFYLGYVIPNMQVFVHHQEAKSLAPSRQSCRGGYWQGRARGSKEKWGSQWNEYLAWQSWEAMLQ